MSIKRFLQETLTRNEKIQSARLLLYLIIAAFLESISLGAILPLFNLLNNSDVVSSYPALSRFELRDLLLMSAIFLVSVFGLKTAFISFLLNSQAKFSYKIMCRISCEIFDKYALTPLSLDAGRDNAKITRNVIREPNFLVGGIFLPILTIATEVSVICGVLLLLFAFSPGTTTVLVASIGLSGLVTLSIARPVLKRLGTEVQVAEGARLRGVSNILGGGKDLFLFNMGKLFSLLFYESTTKSSTKLAKQQFFKQVTRLFLELSAIVILCALIVVGVFFGTDVNDMLALIALYLVGLFRVLPAANRIVINLNTISFNRASLVAVAEELKQQRSEEMVSSLNQDPDGLVDGGWSGFDLVDISFSYASGAEPIIENFSLAIERGEKVALMGPSGSGKSTILDVLLGLQRFDSGILMLRGAQGSRQIPHLPRGLTSYAPQKTFVIEASIAANVVLDDYFNDAVDEERLQAAISGAMLHEVIERVPHGIGGSVGEAGSALSGGELQRVGIARALYRKADLILLDEATSALDSDTERRVIEGLLSDADRTIIFVTHNREIASLFDRCVDLSALRQ